MRCVHILGWVLLTMASAADDSSRLDAVDFRKQIEADWVFQEEVRSPRALPPPTTQTDAAGGCDGVKNGQWGFHTAFADSPWWQVDLGERRPIARIVIWNRCDAADRNNRLMILLSDDAQAWRNVYTHDGTTFYGFTDNKPLVVKLKDQAARFVRAQLSGVAYLHLDELEVFGSEDAEKNIALHRPADQINVSPWSANHDPCKPVDWTERTRDTLALCRRLAAMSPEPVHALIDHMSSFAPGRMDKDAFLHARWIARRLALSNPLLDFDAILFTKRVPGSFNHMSDQYYGWWSRPGGGIYILRNFKSSAPSIECLTGSFTDPGSFLRPALSYDARKILFAWCRHYPNLAQEKDKLNKANVPEDAFYHVFEMNADGASVRQLTRGKYDDFDARYLPDGRIVFLSTRRGQSLQCGAQSARLTLEQDDRPDSYVRCGGGPERPVAVYTLHTMDADGGGLCAISPFEMFEWTPSVARDGTILYSRWDYIDRSNMPFMSLWSTHPDGTNARLVYKNYTTTPHCTFEPLCVPDSNKIIFTASAHHAQTMGSLVLLDPAVSTEGAAPITRLTPEVCFPEAEGWPNSYFTSPWPLSERHYLVAWGGEAAPRQGQLMAGNNMGLYLFDAAGSLELLYRDPEITSVCPIPLRPQQRPPILASATKPDANDGRFVLSDVYRGLKTVQRGDIKALRIVAVPAKTQPTMNSPSLGLTSDDPGKCVLGAVPVEADGSAYFRVPAGVIVFFQALDARGMAVQTMRGVTYVQPGQTSSCVGCHESRFAAVPSRKTIAAAREVSKITVGPEGSWPLRFDRLVAPVIEKHCVACHNPNAEDERAAQFDLSPEKAYASLCNYGKPSLAEYVLTSYRQGYSVEGACAAATSPVLAKLNAPGGHHDVKLDAADLERLITWMDTYGQRLGSFSDDQERELVAFRKRNADVLIER